MKLSEQRLPVMVGDHPNPVGFVEVGTLAGDGFKLKQPDGDDRRIWTGRRAVSVPIRVDFTGFDPAVLAAILGDPLALLAVQARRINPHWYLEAEQ